MNIKDKISLDDVAAHVVGVFPALNLASRRLILFRGLGNPLLMVCISLNTSDLRVDLIQGDAQ